MYNGVQLRAMKAVPPYIDKVQVYAFAKEYAKLTTDNNAAIASNMKMCL